MNTEIKEMLPIYVHIQIQISLHNIHSKSPSVRPGNPPSRIWHIGWN